MKRTASKSMKRGAKLVREDAGCYLRESMGNLCGCALGAGLVGKVGVSRATEYARDNHRYISSYGLIKKIGLRLEEEVPAHELPPLNTILAKSYRDPFYEGITYGEVVNRMHYCRIWNTAECAKWLEEMGL